MKQYNKFRLYLAIAAISFMQGLQFSVSPVLGQIQEHYPDVNVSLVQMLITAPGLFSLVVALISGWLVLKITKKQLLVFAGFVAGVTGLLPLLYDSFPLLLVSRTVYGISLGIATTMNMAVVAEFFEGEARVKAMGIQAASVGAGMVVTTVCAGFLGRGDFRNSYFINLIGFVSMIVLITCLPETGVAKETKTEKIRLNGKVLIMDLFALLENVFLITYTTNIAMHLSGALAGNSSVSGTLTGIFSGVQILAGILLGLITAKLKKYTPAAAMLSFSAGAVLLTLFPGNYALLMVSSVLCGMSQGVFIPTASTYLSNHVAPVATALAAATMTTAMNAGQLLSPVLLNTAAAQVFGKTTTTGVYIISAIGMTISAGAMIAWQHFSKDE